MSRVGVVEMDDLRRLRVEMDDLRLLRDDLSAAAAGAPQQRMRRICEVSVAAVPVAGAAVSVMSDADRRDIVYASDEHATELEELQFALGEGPCVEAFAAGRPVLVADLDDPPDPRWPLFAAAARAATPARAAYAFPLQIGAIRVGILDLYRLEPGLPTGPQLTAALLVADAALWSLLSWRAETGDGAAGDDDGSGWPVVLHRDHAVVYQATGMVMAQVGVGAEAALALLRAHAFARDRRLDEVAAAVVARRLRLDRPDD